MQSSPFLVGIDLGTTNCAVAYVDTRAVRTFGEARAQRFHVAQLVAPRELARHPVLPSFLYLGTEHERESGALDLPWAPGAAEAVGVFARDHGALVPSRLASSAKSWLAHGDVDRTAPILPFGRDAGEPGVSPLEASSRYLAHIRDAWNHEVAHADAALRLEAQQVVLTVPASFDDEARELTAEAAARAGLAHVLLIEEPIAALYAWLTRRGHGRRGRLGPNALVLVCDVGGGTTDFSLIRAGGTEDGSGFERIAIGEHLLLGGDNLDLALTALLEARLGGPPLSVVRREGLRRLASAAKERLLSDGSSDRVAVTVLGGGRSVVGGAAHVDLTREDVVERLLNGFLPMVAPIDRPAHDRRRGLRELGLPYEPDPAITRHLAAFLGRGGGLLDRPDAVLFNGGFFAPDLARQRVVDVLASWFGDAPAVLATEEPDAAVALGAAAYAALRALPDAPRDLLVRAGSPRTYYVELASDRGTADRVRALAVMPRGTDEGTRIDLGERRFHVQTNRPVAFTLWSSTTRIDPPGALIDEPPEALHRQAPLAAVLRYGKRSSHPEIEVMLSVQFTEVGTLELWLTAPGTGHRWRLQFQARGNGGGTSDSLDGDARDEVIVSEDALAGAVALVRATFAGAGGPAPAALPAALEERIGYNKQAWPIDTLRRLADVLIEVAPGRARSVSHEARWLNLAGFCVRPGFGAAADAWRIGELRKVYTAGLAFPREVQGQVEWLVLWQRAAGGFSAGQQQELARRLVASLGIAAKKPPRLNPQVERESWRLVASLERVDAPVRVRVGDALASRVVRDPRNVSLVWALGRVGARIPFYGPLDRVVPPDDAERWLEVLIEIPITGPDGAIAIAQLAARTGDSARDLSPAARQRARERLQALDAPDSLLDQLDRISLADRSEQGTRYFGEDLPAGLRVSD